jgi:hypothetical protein
LGAIIGDTYTGIARQWHTADRANHITRRTVVTIRNRVSLKDRTTRCADHCSSSATRHVSFGVSISTIDQRKPNTRREANRFAVNASYCRSI